MAHNRRGSNAPGTWRTAVYSLAQKGQIPATKVGRRWAFEKSALDAWVRAARPLATFFVDAEAEITENLALREPQREAYEALYEYFKKGGKRAIIQIPVGCGKSGVVAIAPFGISKGRVLVIAPNLTIKDELKDALDVTNRQKCFWRRMSVLTEAQMAAGPLVSTLEAGNISVSEKSHFVLTNIQQLGTNADKWLNRFPEDFFDMVIVDEAHHSAADTWEAATNRFKDAKVALLTATPFRGDRQEVKGDRIYRYSFRSATIKGYVKRLKATYVAPSALTFTEKDGAKTYTLEEVMKMKEKDWFSRGVALSEVCNANIVNASLEKLEKLRETGTRHQLIAVACTVRHAKQIRALYEERGYRTEVIYAELEDDEKKRIIRELKNGTLDCIVQVQMLGEGFDHPKLSVAAIFRPFRSLAPYIQFVGRILRVIVQNYPSHPDNYGHIVTHLGMNLDERLKEFKEFENDDQTFWEGVIGGDDPEPPADVKAGKTRLRFDDPIVANNEIVDSLFEEDFTTVEDQHLIQELKDKLALLGLDPSQAEAIVAKGRQGGMVKRDPAQPFVVQPLVELQQAKKRLHEEVTRAAQIVLQRVELEGSGTEMIYKYNTLGARETSNYVATLVMINGEVAKLNPGKSRDEWSAEEVKAATASLKGIFEKVIRRIKKAQSVYENKKIPDTDTH